MGVVLDADIGAARVARAGKGGDRQYRAPGGGTRLHAPPRNALFDVSRTDLATFALRA